ncbi:MAG: alpha/beta fold hydrolase [Alphaproteobacteria bacterium]|nr:alpha/beta fold hydrolase [Alphaproteobacteria bacterium]
MTFARESAGPAAPLGPAFLGRPGGHRLAYRRRAGSGPGLVWLGGFNSDMNGTKATALEGWAQEWGRACLRFDYFGHGASSGEFAAGTIGRWRDDALAVLDELARGPQILVGSSLGGWIALLAALARPERVAGLFLVAPAPDFTEDLIWETLSQSRREALLREGRIERPSQYGEAPYPISRELIEEGRRHLLLREPIAVRCPVEIVHGMADPDVPWRRSLALVERLAGAEVSATFLKAGDHRLSAPADLDRLKTALGGFLGRLGSAP